MFRQGGLLQLSASCAASHRIEPERENAGRERRWGRTERDGTFNFVFTLPLTVLKSLWQPIAEAISLNRLSLHLIDFSRLHPPSPAKFIFVNGLSLNGIAREYPADMRVVRDDELVCTREFATTVTCKRD